MGKFKWFNLSHIKYASKVMNGKKALQNLLWFLGMGVCFKRWFFDIRYQEKIIIYSKSLSSVKAQRSVNIFSVFRSYLKS